METMAEKFIYTLDKFTADKLLNAGIQLVCNDNGKYIFINPSTINFNNIGIDNTKIVYSNILTF